MELRIPFLFSLAVHMSLVVALGRCVTIPSDNCSAGFVNYEISLIDDGWSPPDSEDGGGLTDAEQQPAADAGDSLPDSAAEQPALTEKRPGLAGDAPFPVPAAPGGGEISATASAEEVTACVPADSPEQTDSSLPEKSGPPADSEPLDIPPPGAPHTLVQEAEPEYTQPSLSNNIAYVNYYKLVNERLRSSIIYPPLFADGEVMLTFVLQKNGVLGEVSVLEDFSADNSLLRRTAVQIVKNAAPFPPFPEDLQRNQLIFNIVICFREKTS